MLAAFLIWHVADMKFSGLFSVLVVAAFVGAVASAPAQTQTEPSEKTDRNPIIDRSVMKATAAFSVGTTPNTALKGLVCVV